ncbi:MAG: 4-(cytidine 5'-diphospho)-2-C-methyl-D-erythritol kinase, partial [Candidatus Krumholzibacteria bacterium]|nr:4-(cytidine 5'-diphospho)-2-C-methyl-D-erythritol kinase [Candidatus Krumholzibacteria bacterium]
MTASLDTGGFTAHARAKVNLALEILGKRQDGYHEIETILQSVNLYDELDIEINRTGRVVVTCSDPEIPVDDTNLCSRALDRMR